MNLRNIGITPGIGAAIAIAAIGCGDNLPGTPDATPPDAGQSFVSGKVQLNYHSVGEVSGTPIDISELPVEAYYRRSDDTFWKRPGEGAPNGAFSIADVPEENVGIRVAELVSVTAARSLDFGSDVMGRENQIYAPDGTALVFNCGMQPWDEGHSLAAMVPNHGSYLDGIQYLLPEEIPSGTATLAGEVFDWSGFSAVEGNEGDILSLVQYETVNNGDTYYVTPVAARRFDRFQQAGGESTELAGDLELVERESLSVEWNVAAYRSQLDDVNPFAFPGVGDFEVLADVPGLRAEPFSWGPVVVRVPQPGSKLSSVFSYGLPLPGRDSLIFVASYFFALEIAVEGYEPTFVFADTFSADHIEGDAVNPVVVVGPPRKLRVNDLSAIGTLSGISTTPRISWLPPTIGTPTAYRVEILGFESYQGDLFDRRVALLVTTEESIDVPPGFMEEEQPYVVRVTSVYMPNTDLTEAPLRESLPRAEAASLSGLLRP